jgi:septal ring factor EnvC (AmiA/AmiB activator)
LIIDHGGGYHSLLAGIDRIDGVVGQWVVTGEPLGTMQPDGQPSLYLELRRQGQPINPLPWLVARDGKASG